MKPVHCSDSSQAFLAKCSCVISCVTILSAYRYFRFLVISAFPSHCPLLAVFSRSSLQRSPLAPSGCWGSSVQRRPGSSMKCPQQAGFVVQETRLLVHVRTSDAVMTFFGHYHHSRHAYRITIAIDSYDHFLVPFSRSEFLRLIAKYTGHPCRATATRRWRARAPWHIHAICFFSSFLFYLLLETALRWCKYAHLLSWLLFHSGDMLNFLWCANCGKTLELPIIHRWNSVVELLPFSLFWSAIFLQVFCMYLLAHNMKRKVKMHLQTFPSFSEARSGPYVARTNGSKW